MKRRPLALAGLIALFTFSGTGSRPAFADEAQRKLLRKFGEEAVYVIEGGRNPLPNYKYSDQFDIDNGIVKNSALAETTYMNRVLLADLLSSNETAFTRDLDKIGRSLQAGRVMLHGDHYDLKARIPLAIPESMYDTCKGACLEALKECTKNPGATGITGFLNQSQRMCLYDKFRKDFDGVIRNIIMTKAGHAELKLWADQKAGAPPVVSPYLAIALGTPVSFYSHNPKKPVGYTFDAKREAKTNKCLDTYDRKNLKLVSGSKDYACSDFDIKIYSPDLTYLFIQSVDSDGLLDRYLGKKAVVADKKAQKGSKKGQKGSKGGQADDDGGQADAAEEQQLFIRLKNEISLNKGIVDGGKRHVFKNDANGKGVYQKFPAIADFVEKWTDAFGREVDVKLEFTFNTPAYAGLPAGPIALVEGKASPTDDAEEGEAVDDLILIEK